MVMDTEVSLHLNSFCVTIIGKLFSVYTNQIDVSFSYNIVLFYTFFEFLCYFQVVIVFM